MSRVWARPCYFRHSCILPHAERIGWKSFFSGYADEAAERSAVAETTERLEQTARAVELVPTPVALVEAPQPKAPQPLHPKARTRRTSGRQRHFNEVQQAWIRAERDEWNCNREMIAPPAEHLRKVKAKGVEQYVFGDEVEIDWIRRVCSHGDSRWALANAHAVRAFFAVLVRHGMRF